MPELFDQINKFANATRRFREQIDFITINADAVFYEAAASKVIRGYVESGAGSKILLQQLKLALMSNNEFGNYEAFRSRLEEVFSQPEIINLYPDIASTKLRCEILAEVFAGSAEDYATAVETARQIYASTSADPLIASLTWRIMYRVAREGKQLTDKKGKALTAKTQKLLESYQRTIETRLAGAVAAPYWYILNYGTTGYGAKVGGEGVAYPYNPPTHFVEVSEYQIEVEANVRLLAEIDRMIDEFEKEVEKFAEQLDEYSPGEIINTLRIGERDFAIYKTPKLGRLGFRRL